MEMYKHLVTASIKSFGVFFSMLHFNRPRFPYLKQELCNSHTVNGKGRNFLGHLCAIYSNETTILNISSILRHTLSHFNMYQIRIHLILGSEPVTWQSFLFFSFYWHIKEQCIFVIMKKSRLLMLLLSSGNSNS